MSEKLTLLDRLVEAMHKRSFANVDRQKELDEKDRRAGEAHSQAGQVVDGLNLGILGKLRSQLRPLNLGIEITALDHSKAGYGPRIEVRLGEDGLLAAYNPDADAWEQMRKMRDNSGLPCWSNLEPFAGRRDFAEKVEQAVSAMLEGGALTEWVKRGKCLA